MRTEWAALLGAQAGSWPREALGALVLTSALVLAATWLFRLRGRGVSRQELPAALLAAQALPLLLLDGAGRVLHLNPGARDLLGEAGASALPIPVGELLGVPALAVPALAVPTLPAPKPPPTPLHLRNGQVLPVRLEWLPWPGGKPGAGPAGARWALLLQAVLPPAGGERAWIGGLLDAVPQRVWIKDLRLRYVRVNRAQAQACGSPQEAFVGHTAQELAEAQVSDPLDFPELDQRVLETGQAQDRPPQPLRLPDGRERYFRVQRLPVKDAQGRLAGVMGVAGDFTELIQAEREQKAQHRLLQEVLNGIPHRIVVEDASGRCVLANRATEEFCSRLGLSSPLGRLARECSALLPGQPELSHQTDRRVLSKGETVELPGMLLMGADGQPTHHHVLKIPLRDEAGQVTGLIGIAMDVTARWQAQQERDRLVGLSPDLLGVATLGGRLLHVNPAFESCMGSTAQELLKAPAISLIHPDDAERARRALKNLGQSAATASAVLRMRHRDGTYRSVAWQANVEPERGRVYFAGRDVTEQQAAERALTESEARFRAVIEALAEGVVVQDPQREIITCNPAAMRILGIAQEQPGGRLRVPPGWTFLDAQGQPLPEADFPSARALRSGQPQLGTLIGARRPGEQALWLSVSAQPLLKEADGKPYAVVNSFVDLTQQKQAELRLTESDRRFRALVNHAPVAIFQADAQGNMVLANERWHELTGLTQEQAAGMGWARSIHPEDRERVIARRRKLLETGKESHLEYRYVKPDGRVTWGVGTAVALRDEQGRIAGLLGTFTDMTDRKRAEAEQAHNLNLMAAITRAQSQYIAHGGAQQVFDRILGDLLVISGSEHGVLAEVSGQAEGQPELKVWAASPGLLPGEGREGEPAPGLGQLPAALQELLQHVVQSGVAMATDLAPDEEDWAGGGGPRLNNCVALPFRHGKRVVGVVVLANRAAGYGNEMAGFLMPILLILGNLVEAVRNDQRRQAAEAAMAEKNQQLEGIFNHMAEGIVILDQAGRIVQVNPIVRALLGWEQIPPHEPQDLGRLFGFLLPGGQPCPADQLAMTRALHEAQSIVGQQISLRRPWGEVALLVSAAPLFDAERRVSGAVAVLRDITELKKLDQLKTDFISTVSHELRTPLAAILGYVQLILEGDTGEINDTQRQFLDIVSKNTERLTTLINGLLDLEKIDSGRMQLASARVNLSELLSEVESTFRMAAQQKGLHLACDVQEHLEVQGDADRLVQVFSNLLSNAVKYTPQGSIHLRAAREDGQVLVTVQDSGIGMTAESLSKLFTKFYRADDAYTRAAGGTGLGLAISRSIVQQHGGRIEVQSIPGKGSEFRVLLPAAPEHPQVARSALAARALP